MTATSTFDFDAAVTGWWLAASGAPRERLDHGGAVVVAGAGSGATAIRLALALPLVTVAAVSPDPLETAIATDAAQAAGVAARCSFATGDAEELWAGRYDLVVLVHALGEAADPQAVLRRAARMVAADGTVVVVEPGPGPFTALADPDAAAITAALARAGLADVSVVVDSDRHLELRARRAP
jgi:2-polyprenyl-3-methyl-5-hydroxy-6-metoxy-1,4-benzoquinol methylase